MRIAQRGAAHLKFLDTSPLKVFAKSIRSIQIVDMGQQLSANVYALTKEDIERSYTNACPGIPSRPRVYPVKILSAFVYMSFDSSIGRIIFNATSKDDESNKLSSDRRALV